MMGRLVKVENQVGISYPGSEYLEVTGFLSKEILKKREIAANRVFAETLQSDK